MIILILILGLILRLINLNQSLWLDEAISAFAARDFSYFGIAFDFFKIDNHPPLFYLLLKLWGQTFGFTDWILRILPVALGVGIIYVVNKITLKISDNSKLALVTGIFTATSPLFVYYSQEVRMYILIISLASLQIWVFLELLKREKKLGWTLFSLLNCLLFFSDYITIFFFPVFLLYPIIKNDNKLLLKILLSFIPLGILFIFWLPIFNEQLIKNKEIVASFPGWQFIVGGATFKNLAVTWMKFVVGRISFEPKLIYYALVGVGSIPIMISLYLAFKQFKKYLIIWLWFIVPVTSGFLFSLIIPVFNYFRFIYVLPAFLILISLGIFQIKKIVLRNLLVGLILLTNVIGLSIYYFDPAQSRENWRQVVDFLENNPAPSDLAVFEFYEPVAPFKWYSKKRIDAIGANDSYFANKNKTNKKMEPALVGKTRVYHFEYLRDLTDPQRFVEEELQSEGFREGQIFNNFYNIGQVSIWIR